MKYKYIISYAFSNGFGNCEIKLLRSEKPNSIAKIKEIEKNIAASINADIICMINFKKVGISWK